jgi:hypothetical protein
MTKHCPLCNNSLQPLDFDDGMSAHYGFAEPTEPECYWCDACDEYFLTEEL